MSAVVSLFVQKFAHMSVVLFIKWANTIGISNTSNLEAVMNIFHTWLDYGLNNIM